MSHGSKKEAYVSPDIGYEASRVLAGIPKEVLLNPTRIRRILLNALKEDNFSILAEADFKFKPWGYTLGIILGESHANIHTYPEKGTMYVTIYSCRGETDGTQAMEYFVKSIPHTELRKPTDSKIDVSPARK